MLEKKYYYDTTIFSNEFEDIFFQGWIFAGFKEELANHNDFITIELFGRSVAIQNMDGDVVAFQNICAHRFNRIQTERSGNRPFFCQYHGWRYDKDGKPKVPKSNTFNQEELACKKLKKYPVSFCGDFVFIHFNPDNTISLQDFLGDYFEELERLSGHFGKPLVTEVIPHKANWKLLIENVLEGYHCAFVHQETLVKAGFCTKMAEDINFEKKHSKWHSPKRENEFNARKSNKLTFLDKRTYQHDSFYHIYIFPSLVFSSTEGYFFYIGNLLPQGPDHTDLVARFYSPRYEGAEIVKPFLETAFYASAVESGKAVILEDKPLVEGCQKGLTEQSEQTGILSEVEEVRVMGFHKVLDSIYKNGK